MGTRRKCFYSLRCVTRDRIIAAEIPSGALVRIVRVLDRYVFMEAFGLFILGFTGFLGFLVVNKLFLEAERILNPQLPSMAIVMTEASPRTTKAKGSVWSAPAVASPSAPAARATPPTSRSTPRASKSPPRRGATPRSLAIVTSASPRSEK